MKDSQVKARVANGQWQILVQRMKESGTLESSIAVCDVYGDTAPKPVQADQEGAVLVSGYSQGQMKMFLDKGQFEDAETEIVTVEGVDGVNVSKKKQEPMAAVKKAISHDAYRMLRVVD
ncbi:hypothetical protein EJ03DRAFT_355416 [Teratosphaeria nubilosa]|uniref:DUF7788 domain-containing protein n=1 Tax=Teratosphaeria nubilosa TaxID=161662 RepID=A0A6G1KW55_9PEZI|nr:hypothetical protein EJ03DRAFT_355416 [Teratosphaeria nubilosa]